MASFLYSRVGDGYMEKLKKIAIVGVIVIVLALLAVTLLLPQEVYVERSIKIDAPREAVFTHIGDLHKWEGWSPWLAKDPEMKLTYSENPAEGVGASYSWTSESQGSGSMKIVKLAAPTAFEGDLDFGDQGTAKAYFFLEKSGEQTKVVWTMKADMGSGPIGKLFGFAMDGMVGPDFEDGLERLKKIVESSPPAPAPAPTSTPQATPTPE